MGLGLKRCWMTHIGVLESSLVRSKSAVGRRQKLLQSDGDVVERDRERRQVERRGRLGRVAPEKDVLGRLLAGQVVVRSERTVACARLSGDKLRGPT